MPSFEMTAGDWILLALVVLLVGLPSAIPPLASLIALPFSRRRGGPGEERPKA